MMVQAILLLMDLARLVTGAKQALLRQPPTLSQLTHLASAHTSTTVRRESVTVMSASQAPMQIQIRSHKAQTVPLSPLDHTPTP